jgi:crotonobetainyl-CoA:carnitine CoA-transferase CaiB-like acyl-CoA transferase
MGYDIDGPYYINVDGQEYKIISEDHKDQVFYHTYKNGDEICMISLNGDANWEANCDIDNKLVTALGNSIESIIA